MRSYNILIVTPNLSKAGGVSSFWNALLPELEKFDNMHVNNLQIGGHGKNALGPVLDQWNFRKAIKQNIDLVFLNPSLGYRSFLRDAFFAKQLIRSDIPFIVFFHGWDLNFEKVVDRKYIQFFQNSFGKAAKIFVLSKAFKNKILEWGYKGEIIIETTNIDSNLLVNFSIEGKLNRTTLVNKTRILFLARLLKDKGIFDTVDAFEQLAKANANVELVIAGDGEDYEALKKKVKNNAMIRVVGHVDGQDKIDYFEKSDIYCLPSYSEGLPTSILEAMAFGLPIITTKVGGLKEFFQDGKMGYFVQVKNIEELKEKISFLISNEEKSKEISRFNYEYAQMHLLNTVVAERLYKQIESVLNEPK